MATDLHPILVSEFTQDPGREGWSCPTPDQATWTVEPPDLIRFPSKRNANCVLPGKEQAIFPRMVPSKD